MTAGQQISIAIYESHEVTKPKYIYKFRVRTRKVKGEYKISYILYIQDTGSDKHFLVISLRNFYPIIEYLSTDERYVRGKDYFIVKNKRYTKMGNVDLVDVIFQNPECARRVTVFILSILGVENRPSWISKMTYVVRKLSPEAVDFWLNTAYDRFVTAKSGLIKRFYILRVAKAMRTLYGGYHEFLS